MAFARASGDALAITVATRLVCGLVADAAEDGAHWGSTEVEVPREARGRRLLGVIRGGELAMDRDRMPVAALLGDAPGECFTTLGVGL
jgi:maltooligosyltrehalose synthase